MKRFLTIAGIAAVLSVLLVTTALAAGPIGGRWAQGTTPQAGTCPMGGTCGAGACPMGGQGMLQGGRAAWAGQPDTVAALLGMTAEDIQAERQAGKSLAQIAASKGVTVDQLVETILAAKQAALQQAVADGRLTQAQADLMIQNMQTMVKTMVERTTTGPLMGGHGMGGYRMPRHELPGGRHGFGMRGGFDF